MATARVLNQYGRPVRDHDGMSSDEWCSPPEVADPLFRFWGVADLDPCSNGRSVIKAAETYTYGGLIRSHKKKTYYNWPYSQNDPWSQKLVLEIKVGRVQEAVVLCMTATSTDWWQRLMLQPRRNPRVICTKRIRFLGPDGKPVDSSRFEPALIYYGPQPKKFDKYFHHLAKWSTWGR